MTQKTKPWLTYLSFVLWILTIAFGSYFFVFGRTAPSVDERIAVVLSPTEREFVLAEMRSLVIGLQGVMEGVSNDDKGAITKSLSSMGMAMAADDSEILLGKLPLNLKSMGMGLHKKMDVLAAQVQKDELTQKELFKELSNSLLTCVSCHSTYRIISEKEANAK